MNYQIKYELTGEAKRVTAVRLWMKYACLALLAVGLCWAIIWSFGGDWAVTVGALETMAEDLGQESDLKAAFSQFCIEILQGAECG